VSSYSGSSGHTGSHGHSGHGHGQSGGTGGHGSRGGLFLIFLVVDDSSLHDHLLVYYVNHDKTIEDGGRGGDGERGLDAQDVRVHVAGRPDMLTVADSLAGTANVNLGDRGLVYVSAKGGNGGSGGRGGHGGSGGDGGRGGDGSVRTVPHSS
jgi:hypothetical protein